jgi:general secretion pathway protein F
MPIFEYTALTRSGREEHGTIDADSGADARRKLRSANVHVVAMREEGERSEGATRAGGRVLALRRITQRDLAVATRQLATLLRAGMPLVPALAALTEQVAEEPMGAVTARLRDRVNEGATLATALSEHPRVFSEMYVNMVRAGEAAGALEPVLFRLAEITEKRVALRNKMRAAMAYPTMMVVVGIAVVAFLLTAVIPSIARLFEGLNRELPVPTQMLIGFSRWVKRYLPLLVIAVVAVPLAARAWTRTPQGRAKWDRLRLRIPLLGDLALKTAVSRFARTLGVLLASGVAILDALGIVRRVVGNTVLSDALAEAGESVRHGESLAGSLRQQGVFPPIVLHMTAAGEASGNVAEGLLHVADAYDDEVEARVAALTSLVEPILIILLGAVVGFIVLAMLLPIFEINQALV